LTHARAEMVDAALTADEAKVYDRQIRVWGVETQQRCVVRGPAAGSTEIDQPLRDPRANDTSGISGVARLTRSHATGCRLRSAKVLFVGCPGVSTEVSEPLATWPSLPHTYTSLYAHEPIPPSRTSYEL
jgi:molybdopterin/thiamine biosynthesis adenylyltransferase